MKMLLCYMILMSVPLVSEDQIHESVADEIGNGPFDIIVYRTSQNEGDNEKNIIVGICINAKRQVVGLFADNDLPDYPGSFKYGTKAVTGIIVTLSNADGQLKLYMHECAAGSALRIIGMDRGDKRLEDLPWGMHQNGPFPAHYILIGRVGNLDEFPRNKGDVEKWWSAEYARKLVDSGKVVVQREASKIEGKSDPDSNPSSSSD